MGFKMTKEFVDSLEARGATVSKPLSETLADVGKTPQDQPAKKKGRARGRHVPGVMNKLEKKYHDEYLKPRLDAGEILQIFFEEVTFKLADKCRYTPDFVVILADLSIEIHETKGFLEGDAQVKLKTAAAKFGRLAKFFLIFAKPKKKGGGWDIREIGV